MLQSLWAAPARGVPCRRRRPSRLQGYFAFLIMSKHVCSYSSQCFCFHLLFAPRDFELCQAWGHFQVESKTTRLCTCPSPPSPALLLLLLIRCSSSFKVRQLTCPSVALGRGRVTCATAWDGGVEKRRSRTGKVKRVSDQRRKK